MNYDHCKAATVLTQTSVLNPSCLLFFLYYAFLLDTMSLDRCRLFHGKLEHTIPRVVSHSVLAI